MSSTDLSALPEGAQYISAVIRDELTCLEIRHPLFTADLLLQGAQLISYAPEGEQNWLWLSELAEYKSGKSLRGGIPVCWPWFGNTDKNPPAVQAQIKDINSASAHGFARERDWHITELEEDDESILVILTLTDCTHSLWRSSLSVEAEFRFTGSCLSLTLTTENIDEKTVSFSQALHTYFPTADISKTRVAGFDGTTYIDTLDNWQEKQQRGDIEFREETDRIYYAEEPVTLQTPGYQLELNTQGSSSAVVWNPWIEKAKALSQFADDAYQRMFCVETANAAADAITLAAGESHSLRLLLSKAVK